MFHIPQGWQHMVDWLQKELLEPNIQPVQVWHGTLQWNVAAYISWGCCPSHKWIFSGLCTSVNPALSTMTKLKYFYATVSKGLNRKGTSAGRRNGATWTSWRWRREMQNPEHGVEQFYVTVHAGVRWVGKQPGKKHLGSCGPPSWPRASDAPLWQTSPMASSAVLGRASTSGQGRWPFLPAQPRWDTSGAPRTALCLPVQDRHGHTGASPAKGREDA